MTDNGHAAVNLSSHDDVQASKNPGGRNDPSFTFFAVPIETAVLLHMVFNAFATSFGLHAKPH